MEYGAEMMLLGETKPESNNNTIKLFFYKVILSFNQRWKDLILDTADNLK